MNKKNPNKVAIYRCVFSDYDIILPELQVYENIDYYLFTDNANLDIFPYKTIFTDSKYRSPSLDNRFIKIITRIIYFLFFSFSRSSFFTNSSNNSWINFFSYSIKKELLISLIEKLISL